mgnify:CR=1 FL=1|jgi:hypothetical protein|tara:strand:+ start:434 stop:607 length:174 start_codon:yes stop_codon:yes gene_type:complete
MTLQELIDKLNSLLTNKYMSDIKSESEVYFFAEDDYNTFDVKIESVDIEDGKIYLSQ